MEEKLRGAGQSHILDHYAALSAAERRALDSFVKETDFAHLNRVLDASLALLHDAGGAEGEHRSVAPPPEGCIFDVEKERVLSNAAAGTRGAGAGRCALDVYEEAGCRLIAEGRAAVLLLAGGSGTRLGVPYPKGLFTYEHEVTDPRSSHDCRLAQRDKSLFEFHCTKVKKVEALARKYCAGSEASGTGKVQVLVMTSEQNDAETRTFFAAHGYFGLAPTQLHFFTQTSLPMYEAEVHGGDYDTHGRPTHRVLMARRGVPLMAPGGNGGVYESLARKGSPAGATESALDMLVRQGVEYVQIFSVDNLLAKIGDPVFFGFTKARRCHVTVKTTPKVSAEERVGVFAKIDGQWGVVEYTELGKERASLRRSRELCGGPREGCDRAQPPREADLLFNCANIASHCCSTAFLAFAAVQMKQEVVYHAAVKKVKVDDGHAETLGVKLEAFIFDMFRHCNEAEVDKYERPTDGRAIEQSDSAASAAADRRTDRFGILQVDRRSEFAPIKNATEASPTDNPQTAAALYLDMTTRWAREHLRRCLCAPSTDPALAAAGPVREGETEEQCRRAIAEALARLAEPSAPPSANAGKVYVEVSPGVSYAGEGLEHFTAFLVAAILDVTCPAETKRPQHQQQQRLIVLLDENAPRDVRSSAS